MKNKNSFFRRLTIIAFAIFGILITDLPPAKCLASPGKDSMPLDCTRSLAVELVGTEYLTYGCEGTVSITYTRYGVVETQTTPYVQGQSMYYFYVTAGITGTVTPGFSGCFCRTCHISYVSVNYLTMPCATYYGHIVNIQGQEH